MFKLPNWIGRLFKLKLRVQQKIDKIQLIRPASLNLTAAHRAVLAAAVKLHQWPPSCEADDYHSDLQECFEVNSRAFYN